MNLFINNEAIEQVQNFDYLSFQVSAEVDGLIPVCHRINKGFIILSYYHISTQNPISSREKKEKSYTNIYLHKYKILKLSWSS